VTASAHGGLRGLSGLVPGGIFGFLQDFGGFWGAGTRTDSGSFLFKTYVQINQ
jgi:hypothetical protein